MYEPSTGKSASVKATFPGAQSLTVYRNGKATTVQGNKLDLTLANREGVFVTVQAN